MNVLITGITGMVGSHLADFISKNHPSVNIFGMIRWRSPRVNIIDCEKSIHFLNADLNDLNSLVKVIKRSRPDKIFHLAAQSYVQDSYSLPQETLRTNILGTTNLLDAVRLCDLDPLIHICSSSEVYGQVNEKEIPIKESNEMRPASPYAVSKLGEDMIAYQYFLSYGLKTIRTRMFTHTGPRRGEVFAECAFAKQIAEIEKKTQSTNIIKVGNLDSIRTFSDVRDAVRAYWVLLEKCIPGDVYNIGGTETLTVGEMLEILKSFSKEKLVHEISEELLRPSDVTLQIPDSSKFVNLTGWKPKFTVKDTLKDLLNFEREKIGCSSYGV